jgi:hypothetical protein
MVMIAMQSTQPDENLQAFTEAVANENQYK